MSQINLLPWREDAREQLKKDYLIVLGIVGMAATMLVFVWISLASARLTQQIERIEYLQRNIAEMDKMVAEIVELKHKKEEMIARMRVIQDLQGNRSEIVKIFDELVRAMPEGVYLSELASTNNLVEMTGFSESNNRISALMRNLDNSHKYQHSNLVSVEQDQSLGNQGSVFNLQVEIEMAVAEDTATQP
jgi:type IV pilus assembly protein PilN